MAAAEKLNSGQSVPLVEDWITRACEAPISLQKASIDAFEPAWQLYGGCLNLFAYLCRSHEEDKNAMLREELMRLYLWGEGFSDGRLDKSLKCSDELRRTVLELLCSIGRWLIRSI
jgi:hypothetical protein